MGTKKSGLIGNKLDANIRANGGIGDGVTNDTVAITQALSENSLLIDEGTFLVDTFDNTDGIPILGDVEIVKTATGGKQRLNTYVDTLQYLTGQEYILPVLNKVLQSDTIKIIVSGDSTADGYNVAEAYRLHSILNTLCTKAGIKVVALNRGHIGKNMEHWRTDYLAADLAENPDLLLLGWGINDPAFSKTNQAEQMPNNLGQSHPDRRTWKEVRNSLRQGLATLRQSKNVSQLSVVVMMPNSTFNLQEGQDARYYEKLRNIYAAAARKYKCAFFDTYALWQDSTVGVQGGWMENDFNDGTRTLHPKAIYNVAKASKLFEFIFPFYFRQSLLSDQTSLPGYSNVGTYHEVVINGVRQMVEIPGAEGPLIPFLPFSTVNTTLSNDEYTAHDSGTTGEYSNKEISYKKLAAGTNGRIQLLYLSEANLDVICGYIKTSSLPNSFAGVVVGFFVEGGNGIIAVLTNGQYQSTGVAVEVGKFYAIISSNRGGTTATYKLVKSSNQEFSIYSTVWEFDSAVVGSLKEDLYPVMMAERNRKLSRPKHQNHVDY